MGAWPRWPRSIVALGLRSQKECSEVQAPALLLTPYVTLGKILPKNLFSYL